VQTRRDGCIDISLAQSLKRKRRFDENRQFSCSGRKIAFMRDGDEAILETKRENHFRC
jgi:hypothetical protein